MKKQFLFLLLLGLLCSVGNVWGEDVTFNTKTSSTPTWSGTTSTSMTGTIDGYTVAFNKGSAGSSIGTGSSYFTTQQGMTISVSSATNFSQIVFNFSGEGYAPDKKDDWPKRFKASAGTLTKITNTQYTWSGDASSITFSHTNDDSGTAISFRFTSIVITPASGGSSYTVTYKSGEGSGVDVVVSPATTIADCPNTFSAPSNKAFAGWKDEDGTSYSVGDDVEEDLTLIAQWEIATSEDVLFSIAMGSESLSSVTQNTEIDLSTNSYATISGGDAYLGNKNSDAGKAQISSSNGVYFNGNDAYVKIVLDKALMTGDVITFTNPDESNRQICFTTTNVRAESEATSSNKYTCTSTFNGISTIYVWRAATGATYIKNLSIKRKVYARTAPTGNWGTICLPFAVSADAVTASGATFYSINGVRRSGDTPTSIVLEEADALVAGNPYIFNATSDFTLPYVSGSTAAQTINGLVGVHSRCAFAEMDVENVYVVSGGQIKHATTSSGVEAYRAYIQMNAVSAPSAAPGRRIIEMPLEGNSATGVNEIEANDKAVKFIENGRILILRDGITYDALGRIVK